MNKRRKKSEMHLLPFISVPSVLKLWAGWRSFFLLAEKTLQNIKKPSAFPHSLLQSLRPYLPHALIPSDHAHWWAGEKSACLDEGRGPFGWTAIRFSQNNECVIHSDYGQTNRAACDEVRANYRNRDDQEDERKREVSLSSAPATFAGNHFPS